MKNSKDVDELTRLNNLLDDVVPGSDSEREIVGRIKTIEQKDTEDGGHFCGH